MVLLNTFCAWMIVLCSFTFLKIIFERDNMTRFHFMERTSIRMGVIFVMISEVIIGIQCKSMDTWNVVLNIGLCIISMFLTYNYFSKNKW
jgi:uncharacterized membrane protein